MILWVIYHNIDFMVAFHPTVEYHIYELQTVSKICNYCLITFKINLLTTTFIYYYINKVTINSTVKMK